MFFTVSRGSATVLFRHRWPGSQAFALFCSPLTTMKASPFLVFLAENVFLSKVSNKKEFIWGVCLPTIPVKIDVETASFCYC